MASPQPFRFEFIRNRYAHLSEEEIVAAEVRFARLLDILVDVAAEHAASKRDGDNRFDETAPAP